MITTVLTSQVRSNLASVIMGGSYTAAKPNFVQWGTGPTPALATDETISDPLGSRAVISGTFTKTSTSGDTLFLQGSLTSSAPQTITNLGIFNNQSSTAVTTLATQLNPGSGNTSVQVSSTTGFPSSYPFDVQALSEVMTVVTGTGTTWTVTRAANGSPISTNVIPAGTRLVGGSGTANGNLFLKTSFSGGLNLNPGDTLNFKISLQFV